MMKILLRCDLIVTNRSNEEMCFLRYRTPGAKVHLSLTAAAELVAAALRSVEFSRILCGVDVNVGGDSCTFLGSLSKALDRYITANDRRGTVVVGKDPAG